jgi:hypothetical protein
MVKERFGQWKAGIRQAKKEKSDNRTKNRYQPFIPSN